MRNVGSIQLKRILIPFFVSLVGWGCSQGFESLYTVARQTGGSGTGDENILWNNQFKDQSMQILRQSCVECHAEKSGKGNVFDLTNPQHLLSTGLVVPGKPDQSPLFYAIQKTMPPSGPLVNSDQLVIENWILAMVKKTTPEAKGCDFHARTIPSGSSVVAFLSGSVEVGQTCQSEKRNCLEGRLSGSFDFLECSVSSKKSGFRYLQEKILSPLCVSCHSSQSAAKGYAYDSYAQTLKSVNIKNPTASRLYKVVLNGSMPRGKAHLTPEQIAQILKWIQAGALNDE